MLLGEDSETIYINDSLKANLSCKSNTMHTTKIVLRTFFYSRFKLSEKNYKKIGAKFSMLANNKNPHAPSENESGTSHCDYFVTAAKDTDPSIDGCLLMSGTMDFHLFPPCSPCANNRLPCISISVMRIGKEKTDRTVSRSKEKMIKTKRVNDRDGHRGLSINDTLNKQKLDNQSVMIQVLNNRIVVGHRITRMVTLTSRVDSTMQEPMNCYDIAKSSEPAHSKTKQMWSMNDQAMKDY